MAKRRFILRKLVDAETVTAALALDSSTPVHEIFMDESKSSTSMADAIGFKYPEEPGWYDGEPQGRRR